MRKIFNRLTSWYFSKGALPYWIILLIDCIIVSFAGYAAFYMQWGGEEFTYHFWQQTRGILIAEVVFIIFFRLFHTYSSVMRYSSVMDLVHAATANLCGTVVTFLLGIFVTSMGWKNVCFPGALGCIEMFLIATMLMWIERVLTRLLYDSVIRNARARRAFIYGVKDSGVAVAKTLQNETPQRFKVVGFVSPEGDLQTKWLMGVQVRKDGPNLIKHMKSAHAHVLIVSPHLEEQFSNHTELVDRLIDARVTIMMFPKIEDWEHNEKPDQKQLHEVHIEDLLPRDKIEVDMDAIGSMLKNKCILITGAAGSIGSEMVRQIAPYQPSHLVLIDQAETPMHDVRMFMHKEYAYIPCNTIVTSITNKQHMERIFAYYKPEYVFHAAAYKHVPMMEDNPAIAVQNNIYGTRVIADLAVKYGTKKFVMISTDKAVNPTNVMGCSKRICEIYCQSLNREIEKLNNTASQPLGVSAPQPLSAPASQPLSDLASQPLSNPDSQQLGASASQPLSLSAPQPLSVPDSQHLSPSASQPLDVSASQPLSNSAPQPLSDLASQPLGVSAPQPLSNPVSQPLSNLASQRLRQSNGALPITQFVTTRFGNVLGSNGSVIPIFREQIKEGGPVTVTHPDIVRYFMLIPEACKLVLEAGTMGNGGEIFVFDMGKPVKIVDLAHRMIKLSGAKDIKVEFTGLRGGEKLYEEVLNDAEQTKPTHHPKIMVAKVREYDYATALHNEERLLSATHTFDDMAIVKIMKEIVPEYKSKSSKYEVLDGE